MKNFLQLTLLISMLSTINVMYGTDYSVSTSVSTIKSNSTSIEIDLIEISNVPTTRSLVSVATLWNCTTHLKLDIHSNIGIADITIQDESGNIIYRNEVDTSTQDIVYMHISDFSNKSYTFNISSSSGYEAYAVII